MQNKVFSVKNIAKSFGSEKERNYIEVIRDISMDIDEKEFIVILGNSGCGKSTFLKILGGIDSATGGSMELYGKDIGRQIPRDALKHFGFVFQSNNLLPWRTAEGNLRFNLNTMKLKGPEWEKRIDEMLDIVGLLDYKKVYPHELSGGMNQRAGIAIAMLMNPAVLLADEPTSALDMAVQRQVVEEMLHVRETFGTAIIIVTHDIGVVSAMADSIVVLSNGRVMEYAAAKDVLENPQNDYTVKLLSAVPRLRREKA